MQSVTRRTVEVRMTRGPCRGQLILFEVETFAGTLVDEAIDPNADPRVDIVLEVAGGRGQRVGTLHARPYTFDPAWKYPWPELQDDASPLRRACRRGRVAALAAWKRRGVLPEEVQHFQVSGVTVSEAFQRCGLGLLLYETALGAVQQFGPAILTAQVCVPWTSATTSPQAAHVWGALRRRYEGGWFAVAPFQRRRRGWGQAALGVDRGSPGLFEKAFKAWLRSEAVYRLADKHAGERSGCTWAEGWCFSLAEALHQWGGWPKWVVLGWVGQPDGSGWWQTEHIVVATPWGFLDGEGFRQRGALLAALHRGWHGPRRRLQLLSAEKAQEKYGDVLEEEGGEAYPPAMVQALLRRLRADFGKPEDWGLR